MSATPKYPAGTWVRFQQNGRLVVGVVQYNTPRDVWSNRLGDFDVITDAGEVPENSILEARRAPDADPA